jgi:uncharacterized protein (TIGR00369 family)
MENDRHFRALERMYLAAPINEIYKPSIRIRNERAEIEIQVSRLLFHAADAVHGSVYFKMLDDAAFFAANSIETEFFLLTTSFTTYLIRPISSGRMKSIGRIVSRTRTQTIAEAVVYDDEGKDVGRGSGVFVRSKIPLVSALGYAET